MFIIYMHPNNQIRTIFARFIIITKQRHCHILLVQNIMCAILSTMYMNLYKNLIKLKEFKTAVVNKLMAKQMVMSCRNNISKQLYFGQMPYYSEIRQL